MKPETLKSKIDIAGNPIYAEHRGLEQWARLQNLKNTAAAFNLMMSYGGMEAFNKLYSDCRTVVATIENGIKANNERATGLKYLRDDISTYNRTKPIYKEYTETKFFKERFRSKHESDIIDHENARRELKNYKRPLPKVETLNEQLTKIKSANVTNNKSLAIKKAELKQLSIVHDYLHYLRREHEPPPPQKEPKQQKRSNDISL